MGWGGGAQTNFALNADTDTVISYMTQKINGQDIAFQGVIVKVYPPTHPLTHPPTVLSTHLPI